MKLSEDEEVINKVSKIIKTNEITYKQYLHYKVCNTGPCGDNDDYTNDTCCAPHIWHVHASDKLHSLPKHPHCDCYYVDLKVLTSEEVAHSEPNPIVWLKMFGKLPDYYITKEIAETEYGWNGDNTIAGKAPGKMIGGNIYKNKDYILPQKEGRIWYECDIDYESGGRTSNRLYYSNDGLIFYSPNHLFGEIEIYWIK